MNVITPTREDEILTKSQPTISPELLDAAESLAECVLRALFYCQIQDMAIPLVVEQMLKCVIDALESCDLDYIQVAHEGFDLVASGAVYGRPVWQEVGVCPR